jgi:hypothetical protein
MPKFYASVGKRVRALEKHEEISHGESMSKINKEYGSLRGNANKDLESFGDSEVFSKASKTFPDQVIVRDYPRNPTGSFPELNDTLQGVDEQNRQDANKVKHGKFPYKA